MSGKIMGQVWDLDLPHAHMLVLLALADHADHQGNNVYPGVGLIAWKCGYSLRQTQRIMDDLIAQGLLIEVESEPGKRAIYRIDLAAGKTKAPYRGRQNVTRVKKSRVTFSTPGGDILADQGVTFSQNEKVPNSPPESAETPRATGTNRHVEPSIEPPPPTSSKKPLPAPPSTQSGGGGGRSIDQELTETEAYLLSEGFSDSAAHEFRLLDLDACRRDIRKAKAGGQQNGGIIKRWRRSPPRPIAQSPPVAPVSPLAGAPSMSESQQKLRELAAQRGMFAQKASNHDPG